MAIFENRLSLYGDGWRRYGALGAAFFLKDRANRIWLALRDRKTMNVEDAQDLINTACFAIRSQMENNYGGEFWPNPGTTSAEPSGRQDSGPQGTKAAYQEGRPWQPEADAIREPASSLDVQLP
jgi:hypothetical protein